MSCELKSLGRIYDLVKVKSYLFGDQNDKSWLQKCVISYSPSRDILALAHSNKLTVLESKWSHVGGNQVNVSYHVLWQGIPDQCDGEVIKSLLCLPVAMSKRKGKISTSPDWTCLVIGFSNGFVRFYTDMGSILLSQQFHEQPVQEIISQFSQLSQYYNKSEKIEDVHILYKTVVCSITGFVLLNMLNACRNQLARVQANLAETSISPSITYKKWSFSNHESIKGCAAVGSVPATMFDHLFTASLCGGFSAKYQNNPPHSQLFVAAGFRPFLGFHFAFDNEPAPVLSEITKVVTSKLKSAVPNWILGGIKNTTKPLENRMELAEEMGCRFFLSDENRLGTSIVMSPLGDVAAVTDNFGRISIIDLSYGLVVRMLKGYRDSHCGWLIVEEDGGSGAPTKRRVEFLVICTPKKGIIEVWTMQFGAKVVSFNVEKDGRLLHSNYGVIGSHEGKSVCSSCIYLGASGEISDFIIPFYYCLSMKNNDKVRDIHMLKNMMKMLREEPTLQSKLMQESVNLSQHLKTAEIIKQAVDSLSTCKFITASVFSSFLAALRERISSEIDLLNNDDFLLEVECLDKLTRLFQFLHNMYELPPDYSFVTSDSELLTKNACDTLYIKENELDKLMSLLPTSRNNPKKVTFCDDVAKSSFFSFLSCFVKQHIISLRPSCSTRNLEKISELLCSGVMYGKCEPDDWSRVCEECNLDSADLLFLMFQYWLHKPLSITLVTEMMNLYKIICSIIQSYHLDGSNIDWQKIRYQLANSDCPLTAITAAIVCRGVSLKIQKNLLLDPEGDTPEAFDWETVTQEDCHWNILISQLEDITFLESALKYQPVPLPSTLYCIPYEPPNIVLSSVLKHGKGAISEFVAKWLVGLGIDPELLLQNDVNFLANEKTTPKKTLLGVVEGQILPVDPSFEAKPIKPNEKEILDLLEKLIAIFPYSLNSNSLLANMAWEYILEWKNTPCNLQPLESTLETLQRIQSPHIKHGCCFLIWSSHLSVKCESASLLINKVGKLPKERLCKQDVGVSEEDLPNFIFLWIKFIDIYIDTVYLMEVTPKPVFRYEPLWESNSVSPKNSVPPLAQLAAKQKSSNQDMLYLISQCARTLHFLTSFPIRITRPLETLFPPSYIDHLFLNVQSDDAFYHPNPDEKVMVNRASFLKKIITSVVNEVLIPYVEPDNTEAIKSVEKLKPFVDWMSKIFALARDWSVPVDSLKRHEIHELYMHGYDRIAEEMISSVSEKQQLGHQLLNILGLRIKNLLDKDVQVYSQFSPTVTMWIASLTSLGDRTVPSVTSREDILQLALVVNNLTLESTRDENLVNLILNSLPTISG